MEKDLDEISNGERPWLDFIREFFRGDGRQHKGLEAMARDEAQHIDYPVVDDRRRSRERRGDPRAHRPVRAVRAGGRGGQRQHGLAARRPGARRPHRREGDGAGAEQGRGPARPRRRSGERAARLPGHRAGSGPTCSWARRPRSRPRAEGRASSQAEASVAAQGRAPRREADLDAGAAAAQPAARPRSPSGRRRGGRRQRRAVSART